MSLGTRETQVWGQMHLPLWPLASDDLKQGIYRMARQEARGRRYIEANPKALSNLLVVDVDHPDAVMRALWDRKDWQPNAVVENPDNGHAHAVWALAEPVTRTEYAHRKPLAFATAVTEGLRRSVDGDAAYSGLMTKNPEHVSWNAYWITDELHTLSGLAGHLEAADLMPAPSWRRARRRQPVGLGRNCSIFETARHWAYREIRKHWNDSPGLRLAVLQQVQELNVGFSEPLPANEARDIAFSIHRWITTKSRMWLDGQAVYEATFTTIQSARGRKGGRKSAEKRTQRRQERAQQIIQEEQA